MSTKTGVAPSQARLRRSRRKVKAGQITASPGLSPIAIRQMPSASVPLAVPNDVSGTAESREFRLEPLHLRSQDVLPLVDRAEDRAIHPLADAAALRLEIDERDRADVHQAIPPAVRRRSRGVGVPVSGQTRSAPSRAPFAAHPADAPRGHAGHQREIRHIARHHRAAANEAVAAERMPAHDGGVGPDAGALPHSVRRNSDFRFRNARDC